MMNIIEVFLHRTFILSHAAKRLQENVPARPKRKKSASTGKPRISNKKGGP